jgi:methionyl aminopeptidase
VGIRLKTAKDLAGIWRSGQITGQLLVEIGTLIKPGITTAQLDAFAEEFIAKHGGRGAFKGYRGFPATICASVNAEIVHGIPGPRTLAAGDIISIDTGAVLDGYVSDAATSFWVGVDPIPQNVERLFNGTRESLSAGIAAVADEMPLRMVSRAIENVLRQYRLGIIRELTGHGVGYQLHEEPTLYNYDTGSRRPRMENGLVVAIEPMASLGSENLLLGADDWTYSTADGSLAAHYEHTVALWEGQAVVLTDPADETARAMFGPLAGD